MTFWPINLPFWSGRKVIMVQIWEKEKSHKGASFLVWEKSHNGALYCTKMTFLQNRNEPHLLKSTPLWLFSRPEMKHLCDFSLFSQICTMMTFLPDQSWGTIMTFLIFRPKASRAIFRVKNALIPQLIDADGRTLHKDSESGPNSKITKTPIWLFSQTLQTFSLSLLSLPIQCKPWKNWWKESCWRPGIPGTWMGRFLPHERGV